MDTRFLEAHGAANQTCGSCALLCLLEGGALYAAIVGDSRAILVRRGAKGAVSGGAAHCRPEHVRTPESAPRWWRAPGDKEAIRYNESEARGMRREAIKRVGGTLMVTRALGGRVPEGGRVLDAALQPRAAVHHVQAQGDARRARRGERRIRRRGV